MPTNTERLVALLAIDEEGERLAGQLTHILVDEQKRELLRLKLDEISESDLVSQHDITLTRSEADVLRIVQGANMPLTASDIVDRSGPDAVDSLRYRQHASATLNKLVVKDFLGKVQGPGRSTYFAPPRDAVKQALVYLGHSPEECDLQSLSDITGLSLFKSTTVIKELHG